MTMILLSEQSEELELVYYIKKTIPYKKIKINVYQICMPEFSNNAPKTADTASFKDYDIMFYKKKLAVVNESNVPYRGAVS